MILRDAGVIIIQRDCPAYCGTSGSSGLDINNSGYDIPNKINRNNYNVINLYLIQLCADKDFLSV